MLRSMTGYGRAERTTSDGRFAVELQSLNKKYLDILPSLPAEFTNWEADIRKTIGQFLSRGQLNVRVSARFEKSSPMVVKANLPLAKQFTEAWEQIAVVAGIPKQELTLGLFASAHEHLFTFEEDANVSESYRETIFQLLEEALKNLIRMKETEGTLLQKDFDARLTTMANYVDQVAERTPEVARKYRERLLEKVKDALPNLSDEDDRIAKEIAIYADRVDITEEITRFRSHIQHFQSVMRNHEPVVGKTLEFILQEMQREANTMGVKCSEAGLSQTVIAIKAELEKVREQIQNIE